MRYSQVLLNYAECINELNGGPDDATGGAGLTARQALAQVHTRAFAENAKSAAQDYVNSLPTDKEGFFNALLTRTHGNSLAKVSASSTWSAGIS